MRAQEAKALLASGHFAGSYYLMGYSVECAIKAAIAKRTQRHDFPDKQLAFDSYKHDLLSLLQTAGLRATLDAAMAAAAPLRNNWAVVKDWTETVLAMQKSQIGFQAALQVRNRLAQAYTDVMNMQV